MSNLSIHSPVTADELTTHIDSEFDLIQQPVSINLENNHPSRFTELTKFWSEPITIMDGFHHLYNPEIIKLETYSYRMYLFGWAHDFCNSGIPGCDAIFSHESNKLDEWQFNPNTKLINNNWQISVHAGKQFWDEWHIGDPSVLRLKDFYLMAYSTSGFDADRINPHPDANISIDYEQDLDGYYYTIGGAYSNDGLRWIKINNPLLTTKNEYGKKDFAVNATYHRPSLIYDNDRFKIWFDYFHSKPEYRHSMGYAELLGPPSLKTFLSANWIIKQANEYPAIPNWPNPEVIKLPFAYLSFADPKGHGNIKWIERKTSVAFSKNGIDWKILGFIEHDDDCDANHIPEAFVENETVYLLTACMNNLQYTKIKRREISFKKLNQLITNELLLKHD